MFSRTRFIFNRYAQSTIKKRNEFTLVNSAKSFPFGKLVIGTGASGLALTYKDELYEYFMTYNQTVICEDAEGNSKKLTLTRDAISGRTIKWRKHNIVKTVFEIPFNGKSIKFEVEAEAFISQSEYTVRTDMFNAFNRWRHSAYKGWDECNNQEHLVKNNISRIIEKMSNELGKDIIITKYKILSEKDAK